eukprot:gene23323-biopygen8854
MLDPKKAGCGETTVEELPRQAPRREKRLRTRPGRVRCFKFYRARHARGASGTRLRPFLPAQYGWRKRGFGVLERLFVTGEKTATLLCGIPQKKGVSKKTAPN